MQLQRCEPCSLFKSKCANLTTIIYTMNYTEESEKKYTNINGIDILSFNDVVELGNKPDWADIGFKAPTAGHTVLIMYTSGSTGKKEPCWNTSQL